MDQPTSATLTLAATELFLQRVKEQHELSSTDPRWKDEEALWKSSIEEVKKVFAEFIKAA